MRFGHPQILTLLLLVGLALAGFLVWAWRKRQRLITHFVRDRLLAQLTVGVSRPRQKIQMLLVGLAVICAGLALARPQWGFVLEEARQRGLDIVVAIDTSRSMLADDLRPNRLERAKLAALDVMRVAHSDRLALVPFAGTAFLQCPLTLDQEAFRQNVQALGVGIMPQGGTALAEAIRVSHAAFEKGTDNTKVLLLLTDGEDHEDGALEAAREAAGEGLRIFTLGVGTLEGEVLRELDEQGGTTYVRDAQGEVVKSRLNERLLRQLAAEAEGFYLPLQASDAVETLYAQGLSGLAKSELASREYRRYHERFQWPLGLAMLLLIVEMFLPERIGKQRRALAGASPIAGTVAVLLTILLPSNLFGAAPGQAQKEYDQGRYDQAREAYEKLLKRRPEDPRLLYNAGTAAYRAQDYTNAIEVLGKATTAADLELQQRALFNLGDALYRQGERVPDRQSREDLWRQAVQNFEAALKLNPQDRDAEFNRHYVEQKIEELKQQEPEKGEQGKGEEQKDQGDKEDQEDQGEGSEKPEPSEGSEQQQQPQQQQQEQQEQQQQQGSQPAPGPEGDEGKSEAREMPRPEGMTEQEAEQMLDAFRQEERPLIYQPSEQERKRRAGIQGLVSGMRVGDGTRFRRECGAEMIRILGILLVMFAAGGAAAAAAAAASLTAALDRDTIYEGETAEVAVTLQNATSGQAPIAPEVAGLMMDPLGQTQQQTWVNGVYHSAMVYRYALRPAGAGEYKIPAFTMNLDGTTVSTRNLRLRVLPGQNPAISQFAFLRLRTEKKRVFLGEALPVEIEVVYRRGGEYREAPQLGQEGLTMGRMEQLSPRAERIGGADYFVDTFRTYVIAARTGKLKLGPATVPFGVPVQTRLGLFGRELRAVKLMSAVIDLEVLALPSEGVPEGFTGAVGKYAMSVEVSTNVVAAGDPILITVDISGEGPIQSLQLEGFADWKGFKTYAPETSVELKDKLGLQGTKRFTQVVIPESAEVRELPPIQFSFFDPAQEKFQVLRHGAVPITVRRGSAVAVYPGLPGASVEEGEQPEARDIVHIKSRLGSYGIMQPPVVMRPWFMVLQIAPLLGLLGVMSWQWQRARVANDPKLRRRQQVARVIREGMNALRAAAARNDAEAFFATVFRMLQEQLGEVTGMPASAVDELVLDGLGEGRMDEELAAEVRRLFHSCGVARYAPGRLNAELHSFIPRVESALNGLRSVDPQ